MPAIVTFGMFDGLHLGHQSLLSELTAKAKKEQLPSIVITFDQHPRIVLGQEKGPLFIQSLNEKEEMLKLWGVSSVKTLHFTASTAQLNAKSFLENLLTTVPFSHLVLGYDTKMGKDRESGEKEIRTILEPLGITITQLPPLTYKGSPISSQRVRLAIQKADFTTVKDLLGRPYTLQGFPIPGLGLGKKIGFPTLNVSLEGLLTPPYGVYCVMLHLPETSVPALANVGLAPTVREDTTPLLEVYALKSIPQLSKIKVEFLSFVRPEKKFPDQMSLKLAIQKDVQYAQEYFTQHE